MIELSDISFVLSGGSTNALAIDSLGGEPSVTVVPTRLFNNIEPEDAEAGFTDYRCVYLANDNETDTLYHTIIFSDDEIADGASVELGMTFQNDVQQVAINDTVTSGGFDLLYEDQIFTVNYNASLSTWASNFQTAIRAITNLEDVTVTGSTSGTRTIFTVEFSGDAGNRYHELLVLDDNNLSPTVSISISKIANGSPINSVATEIDSPTTAPNNITFYSADDSNPLEIGELRPTDMVPIWIKRSCDADTTALENDGFTLKIQGNPIE
jgi:hypothetical protein